MQLGILLLLALLAACASRSVSPPLAGSPLAADTAPAPRPPSVVLVSDPPLPGEPATGWDGLNEPTAAEGAHAH